MCKEQLFSKDIARENPCCNARTRTQELSCSGLPTPSFMVTVRSDQSLPVAWASIALGELSVLERDKMQQIYPFLGPS